MNLEYPDIPLKQYPKKIHNLFSRDTCKVAVNYWVYDKSKRIVVHTGTSRACGCNHHKTSIHAEQVALEYIKNHKKNRNLINIFLYRESTQKLSSDDELHIKYTHRVYLKQTVFKLYSLFKAN